MSSVRPTPRRVLAVVAALLSCAASASPAQAQQIIAYSAVEQPLHCVITGRRVDGGAVVLHDGVIGPGAAPNVIAVPHELWPPGAGEGGSPQFYALDVDCMLPASPDLLTHYRKSLRASSNFWISDISGEPILPEASRQLMLIFRSYDAFSSDTLTTDTYLSVRGQYAPVTAVGDWKDSNWQRYRFPKELKRSTAPAAAAGSVS